MLSLSYHKRRSHLSYAAVLAPRRKNSGQAPLVRSAPSSFEKHFQSCPIAPNRHQSRCVSALTQGDLRCLDLPRSENDCRGS